MDRDFGAKESFEFCQKYNFSASNVDFDGTMEN